VDGLVDVADALFIVNYQFAGGTVPTCPGALDTNDDGVIDISDTLYLILYLFLSGNAPPEPFLSCGTDPDAACLPCTSYPQCP
jgi:hypothetical protein